MYKILLVDDYKPNLRILEETFAEAGFEFRSASSVRQAESLLEAETFDLVLSDIQMPGESGFDLLNWIQARGMSEIPVLLITSAMPEAEHRIRGLSMGAVDYILRSLSPDEIILRVQKAIEHVLEIKKLKASLEDSEKLASLGRIIAASNHEVKNLAQIVRLSAESIARRGNDDEEDTSALLQAASMLADVTRSMNSLLKDESSPTQNLELGGTVLQMVHMSKLVLKGISIECRFEKAQKYWVKASSVALKQVVLNLFLNARDAINEAQENSGAGVGLIIIDLISEDTHTLRLDIRDDGLGLSSRACVTEFPAFNSTKQLRGGTGLGLWLASRLLKGMGARLQLESEGPGTGAKASLFLEKAGEPGPQLDLSRYLSDT